MIFNNYSKTYRIAFGTGIFGLLILGWISGAVGIIGSENNPVNLLYWLVPATMLLGSIISRLKPIWMAYALFATATIQFLIPIIALIISPNISWGNAWVIIILIINSIFSLFFLASGFLFRIANNLKKLWK